MKEVERKAERAEDALVTEAVERHPGEQLDQLAEQHEAEVAM